MTLFEGKRFTHKDNNSVVYEVIGFTLNGIILQCIDKTTHCGSIKTMTDFYFNECDKLGLWEEC